MADVKISALPAATTPLAGTEVLPIVQSSTTKKVAISDVTAGRAVSASSLTLTTPLGVASGGTGLSTLTAGYIPYGNGTGAFSSSSNLYFDGSNIGVGTATTTARVTINRTGDGEYINANLNGTTWLGVSRYSNSAYLGFVGVTPIIGTTDANAVTFITNNSEKMRLDSAGNLGVGVAPTARLDVYGSGGGSTGNVWEVQSAAIGGSGTAGAAANNGGVLSFDGTFTTGNARANLAWIRAAKTTATSGDATGNLILGARSGSILFTNNPASGGTASSLMTLDASGNLGVGTSSPQETLTVAKSSSGSLGPILSSWNTAANADNNAAAIGMRTSSDFTGANIYGGLIKTILTNAAGHANEMSFSLYSDGAGGLAERMRIDTNGNVGIGTTSPGTKLHVYTGSATATQIRAQNTNGYADFGPIGDGTIYGPYASPAASTSLLIGTSNSNPVLFYTNGSERARIDSSGNLLVGTTSADARCQVQSEGTTSATRAFRAINSSSTELCAIMSSGEFYTGSAGASPYNSTTASAANLFVVSTGQLQRSTSSRRYKTNIVDAVHGLTDVLNLRSVTYKGKNDGDKIFGGLIAEEVDAVGLTEFVVYDEEGKPDALHYGNMAGLFVKAIQELAAKVQALEAKVQK